jgi:hypothetical protein
MSEDRLPVKANKYRLTGTRDLGRPSKRWVSVQAEEPNPRRGEEEELKIQCTLWRSVLWERCSDDGDTC